MHPRLHSASRFQDLLVRRAEDDPYVFATIFDNETWRSRRLSAKKLKLLREIDSTLRAMLEPGEKVHFVTIGNGVSFWESYLLGWVAYAINRRAIILTDHRILLLQIDRKLRPHTFRSQLRYLAIDSLTWPLLGGVRLRMRSKKTRLYSYMPRRDRGRMRDFIKRKKIEFRGYRAEATDLENVCPHCHQPVEGHPRQCPGCHAGFKSRVKASLLSFLFPGLGDLYLGHKLFGGVEIAAAALTWLWFLLVAVNGAIALEAKIVSAASLLVFMHGLDALVTRHVASKGLYPMQPPAHLPHAARAASSPPDSPPAV